MTRVLRGLGVDFMSHAPVPDDHRFRYVRARGANPDFERRIGRYDEFATRWAISEGEGAAPPPASCQFVAIVGADEASLVDRTRAALPEFEVVRSTSPLDGRSIWVEVRPPGAGKARAVAWLAARHRLAAEHTAAVGNDYNDSEMLAWSANAYVVGNAPADLRERFRVVSPNDAGGFSEVVEALRRDAGGFARARLRPGRDLAHGVSKGLAGLEGGNGRGGDGDALAGTGFRPWRAGRLLVEKVPNPAMVTVSPAQERR